MLLYLAHSIPTLPSAVVVLSGLALTGVRQTFHENNMKAQAFTIFQPDPRRAETGILHEKFNKRLWDRDPSFERWRDKSRALRTVGSYFQSKNKEIVLHACARA